MPHILKKPMSLYDHQKTAVEKLKSGMILVGGVGSGKSRTALAYYFIKECEGQFGDTGYSPMTKPKDLYIITTARKRDTFEWENECIPFLLSPDKQNCVGGVGVYIDSWNNIRKYTQVKNAFFIFDEQRVIGNGTWVKSFLKITQANSWLILSATPGDTWMDYIPVFIANGWYKNRTEFVRRHVVYSNYSKYPKIDHFVEVPRLVKLRDAVIVNMHYMKHTVAHNISLYTEYNKTIFSTVMLKRWNPWEQKPIQEIGELCYLARRVVNSDKSRLDTIALLLKEHPRVVIFYNFNYERDMLLSLGESLSVAISEWNGHKHEPIPQAESWIYIVQYAAGAEGWNCVETDTIIFYSQNYSYKATIQAAGRIDRMNTPFTDLYYYYLRSHSGIDLAIQKAFNSKRDFNEKRFLAS